MSGFEKHARSENGWEFSYLVRRFEGASKTIVLLPAAQVPAKRRIHHFSRWQWADDFDANVVAVSDPTIQLDEKLVGGWFQGKRDCYLLPLVLEHLAGYLGGFGHDWSNCCFVGSSLGGFAALQSICLHPEARAYVEIPQIDLRAYSDPSMQDLAKFAYDEPTIDNLPEEFGARLSVIDLARKTERIGMFHYVQQAEDGHHLRQHYKPFFEHVSQKTSRLVAGSMTFEVITDRRPGPAHQALLRHQAVPRIKALLER